MSTFGRLGSDWHALRHQLVLRGPILAAVLLALAATRAAGEPILTMELLAAGLAFICLAYPDRHVGLVMVVLIGAHWLVAVDDATSPWAIVVAVALAILHASMAATSVGPVAAVWTPAMGRRWMSRLALVAVASVPTWALVALVDNADSKSSLALFVAALLVLAMGGVWARSGHLSVDPPKP